MKKIFLPASYAPLSEYEQRAVSGGGELKDAAGNFFDNLHLSNFIFHKSFISVSFTFVPMLLFRLVKAGFNFVQTFTGNLSTLFRRTDQAGTELPDNTIAILPSSK